MTLGQGALMKRCEALDITRARDELGFEPQYDVEAGIRQYAAWMQSPGISALMPAISS